MKLKRLVPFLLVVVILVNSVGLVLADDTTNYTYDANGNLLSDGVQCFNYNDANQLAAVQTCATNTLIAEYVYDHTGQRIIEKHYQNGVLQETVYTIGKQAETVVAAGGARQDTTYYRANSEIVARESADGSKVFYHQDHLGSTGALTDAGGQLVEETRYYPFGAVRTGGALSRFLYTGQESDAETGLYYYGARFYDPALARFVQPDSMLPEPYDPQQLNRYSYVANNPLRYTDPSGHKLTNPLKSLTLWLGNLWKKTEEARSQSEAVISVIETATSDSPHIPGIGIGTILEIPGASVALAKSLVKVGRSVLKGEGIETLTWLFDAVSNSLDPFMPFDYRDLKEEAIACAEGQCKGNPLTTPANLKDLDKHPDPWGCTPTTCTVEELFIHRHMPHPGEVIETNKTIFRPLWEDVPNIIIDSFRPVFTEEYWR